MNTGRWHTVQKRKPQLPLLRTYDAYLKDIKEEDSQTILPRVDQLLLGYCEQHLQSQHRSKAQQFLDTIVS